MRPLGLSFAVVLLAAISLLCVQLQGFADDPGIGWHLATGQWISEFKEIPAQDKFLFSKTEIGAKAHTWLPEQWLADLILFQIYKFGSWPALYSFGAVVYLATFIFIVYPTLLRSSRSYLYTALVTLLVFKLGQIHFILRPVLFNYPLFALVLSLCVAPREKIVLLRKYLLILVPLLFALWANLHPAFVFGLILIFFRILAETLNQRWWSVPADWRYQKTLLLILLLSFLGTLINPYGYQLYAHIAWHSESLVVSRLFTEWQAINLKEYAGTLLLASAALVIFAFIFTKSLNAFYFLSFMLFFPWAASTARVLPFYALACAPLFIQGLVGLQECLMRSLLFKFPKLVYYLGNLERLEQRAIRGYSLCLAILLWVSLTTVLTGTTPGVLEYGPSSKKMPVEAVRYLNAQMPSRAASSNDGQKDRSPQSLKVMNDIDWGGYLTLAGNGKVQAYIDDRAAMLGDSFIEQYLEALKPTGGWESFIRASGAHYLLLRQSDPLNIAIESKQLWPAVYRDQLAIVYKITRNHDQ